MTTLAMNTRPMAWGEARRLGGLRRFAFAITFINVIGHTLLGFEQAWIQPLVSLAVTYSLELLFETIDARRAGRRPRYAGGPGAMVDFLLSAHITGLAVAMLLYANARLGPVAFAAAVAITSKHILRVPIGGRSRHFLNPSNFGIAVTLLVCPWVGVAPPYQYTADLRGALDWIVPLIIVCTGTMVNAQFTKKLPLIASFVVAFACQALVRSSVFGTPLLAALVPMTGPAFVLFIFYMLTDPGTTPEATRSQIVFGVATAAAYGIVVANHMVYGFFLALSIVCMTRGVSIALLEVFTPAVAPAELREVSVRAVGGGGNR